MIWIDLEALARWKRFAREPALRRTRTPRMNAEDAREARKRERKRTAAKRNRRQRVESRNIRQQTL